MLSEQSDYEFKMVFSKRFFECQSLPEWRIEDFDLNGVKIVATSDDWHPFTTHSDCDDTGRNCKNSGLAIDKMKIWAEKFNFTWDIKAGFNGDWGFFPVYGKIVVSKYNINEVF